MNHNMKIGKGILVLKKLLLLVVLILSLVFSGCGKGGSPVKDTTAKTQPLKIGVMFVEDNLPLFLAEAENRFATEGLDVKLIPFPSAAERDAALQARQIDGEAADIIAACLLKKGGTDIRISNITLGATPQEGRFVLLGSPDSAFKTAQDLKNVTIAISENTIIEYVTDTLLTKEGLTREEIQKLNIPKMPIRLQMLINNQVKAAVLADPFAALAEKQGARVILDDTKSSVNVSQVVLLFRKDSIETKKQEIRKLIKIYGQAADDLNRFPDKYEDLVFEKAKIPDLLKGSYKSPMYSPPQAPHQTEIRNVVNWMVEKKLLEKAYTYEEIVDSSLI